MPNLQPVAPADVGDFNLCRQYRVCREEACNREEMTMTNLVTLVMQSAAIEVLQEDADQIDQEVQQLLAEIERTPVEECRRGSFAHCFLELLKRRGEVARKAMVIFKETQSGRPRAPEPVNWTIRRPRSEA